jgi:lysylphosphatidylglycerol synthetase-like protein (DUF2156 family)
MTNEPVRRSGTPLASKIVVVASLVGIAVAVVGSFVAPRTDRIYYTAAAFLIPATVILASRLF